MSHEFPRIQISAETERAIQAGWPVLAFESTVITHGLPHPQNLKLAQDMEQVARQHDVTPATIAVLEGAIRVGLPADELDRLSRMDKVHKISVRDLGPAMARGWSGGTTVAATMVAAQKAGIGVFATGGIGGVHRGAPFDVSADLLQLARTPIIVVCAGAKAILDLPATLEYLETQSVPVVGYQTENFPAFYSLSSGLKASVKADTAQEVVDIARAHWSLGNQGAVLVVNPPPKELALPNAAVEDAVQQALGECERLGIRGQGVTPFLLNRVSELTRGGSMEANLGLLVDNARVGCEIARALSGG